MNSACCTIGVAWSRVLLTNAVDKYGNFGFFENLCAKTGYCTSNDCRDSINILSAVLQETSRFCHIYTIFFVICNEFELLAFQGTA